MQFQHTFVRIREKMSSHSNHTWTPSNKDHGAQPKPSVRASSMVLVIIMICWKSWHARASRHGVHASTLTQPLSKRSLAATICQCWFYRNYLGGKLRRNRKQSRRRRQLTSVSTFPWHPRPMMWGGKLTSTMHPLSMRSLFQGLLG